MLSEHEACIIMNLIPGIGIARFRTLVQAAGSAAKALEMSYQDAIELKNIGQHAAAGLASWQENARWEEEITAAATAGVRIIAITDEDYPEILRTIHDPPLCVYVRGNLPDSDRAIAIVGSRQMSAYGKRMAERLATQAAAAGWWVVSGLAYGIDGAAHQAVLRAGGLTAAVLGSGLSRIHPQEHCRMAQDIVESGGSLISEYPLFNTVNRRTLPRRNRLISAFSRGVCVVEAGTGSGALITANQALEQGRSVYAVPGHADNPGAVGSNGLIKAGEAMLIEDFSDIINDLEGVSIKPVVPEKVEAELFEDSSNDIILKMLAKNGPVNFDRLVSESAMPTPELMTVLMKLEMADRITKLPGNVYSLK